MACPHRDCGWCYYEGWVPTNSHQGACLGEYGCPVVADHGSVVWPEPDLPPINLLVLPSANNFYPDGSYIPTEDSDEEEHY